MQEKILVKRKVNKRTSSGRQKMAIDVEFSCFFFKIIGGRKGRKRKRGSQAGSTK